MIDINGYPTLTVEELIEILKNCDPKSGVIIQDGNLKNYNITGINPEQGWFPNSVQFQSDGRID